MHPQVVRRLPDGSHLTYFLPSEYHEYQTGSRLLVHLVEYTITDSQLEATASAIACSAVLSTLQALALKIACAYHKRRKSN